MKFENKPKGINIKEYIRISFILWGGAPVDVTWATETSKYKDYVNLEKDLNVK